MMWFELPGLSWSAPLGIGESWPPDCSPDAGVYLLIAQGSDKTARPISRVLGEDRSGTLYIGQAGSLASRVNELRKTLRPAEYTGSHGAGRLLLGTPALATTFPPQKLATRWALSPAGVLASETEEKLLDAYTRLFGEGPPLNRQRSIPSYD